MLEDIFSQEPSKSIIADLTNFWTHLFRRDADLKANQATFITRDVKNSE